MMVVVSPWRAPGSGRRALLLGALALALSGSVLLLPQEFERLGELGYVGVFLVTLVASGGLILPLPYLATIFVAARSLDPVAVALVAATAGALGELTGWALGASGRMLVEDRGWLKRLAAWRGRRAFLAIVVASAIPNPAFDLIGMAAGAVGVPAWRFTLATFLGKSLRFLLIATLGHQFLGDRG
ncbi:MAG: VTT domain-containing protein [Chloroflexi bacterium]|nr:VTT domain-containing protein [Chloroflexota bacterium]